MSLPPVSSQKTVAGIAVDPHTLERVIPESRRADGTIRKQRKIRPGFTPQEDISRFRGSRQAQMDANALPKGHIPGWIPPSSAAPKPLTKSAKKNAKRKEKKQKKQSEARDNWEDDEDDEESDRDKKEDNGEEGNNKDTATDNNQVNSLKTALENLKVS